ncbi:MAG: substrate-binding domain-containing protein, partial [Cognatishimia sp.]|nr:substrate-binding domain-containing protein [Cognatishimia sp.]
TDDNFHIGSENGLVAWQYALEGFGLSIMDDLVAQRLPFMRRLVTEEELLKYPVWLATHQELHTSRRIRLVFDMLSDYLKRTYKAGS